MLQLQAQAMAILIRINLATVHVRGTVTRITLISLRQTSRLHPVRQHHACYWNTRCICAIHWPKEWTLNHIAYTHLKLFYHKVWKIWVISKLPDRPMSVNWCFIFCFQIFLSCFQIYAHLASTKISLISRRIGWKFAGLDATVSLSNQTT